jgi:hypothetical protein
MLEVPRKPFAGRTAPELTSKGRGSSAFAHKPPESLATVADQTSHEDEIPGARRLYPARQPLRGRYLGSERDTEGERDLEQRGGETFMSDIYDLIHQVKQHPDYLFGTIFTSDDFTEDDRASVRSVAYDATEWLVNEGWKFVEAVADIRGKCRA